jgi:tripartite-type tricarboxylate transporter receptor subunit TctC
MKRFSITALGAILCGSQIAAAEVYPSRPITIVVPYAAGGTSETVVRTVAEQMRTSLGQPAVIENVPGASGSIGVGRVARSAPDGYTLVVGNLSTHVANAAIYTLPYDVVNDFEAVALLVGSPWLITARKTMPADDLKGFVQWLKVNEGRATAGTPGAGSLSQIGGILFQNRTGALFQAAPYRGGSAQVMQDLVAGHIDWAILIAGDAVPQLRPGNIKAYAVMAKNRLAAAPEIPSVDEVGVPELYLSAWFGLWAPRNTPKDAVDKISGAVVDALADPAVRQRFAQQGLEIPPREQQTPAAPAALQKAEIDKWWPIIQTANISLK